MIRSYSRFGRRTAGSRACETGCWFARSPTSPWRLTPLRRQLRAMRVETGALGSLGVGVGPPCRKHTERAMPGTLPNADCGGLRQGLRCRRVRIWPTFWALELARGRQKDESMWLAGGTAGACSLCGLACSCGKGESPIFRLVLTTYIDVRNLNGADMYTIFHASQDRHEW